MLYPTELWALKLFPRGDFEASPQGGKVYHRFLAPTERNEEAVED